MYDRPFIFANSRTDKENVRIKLRKYFDNKNLMALKQAEPL